MYTNTHTHTLCLLSLKKHLTRQKISFYFLGESVKSTYTFWGLQLKCVQKDNRICVFIYLKQPSHTLPSSLMGTRRWKNYLTRNQKRKKYVLLCVQKLEKNDDNDMWFDLTPAFTPEMHAHHNSIEKKFWTTSTKINCWSSVQRLLDKFWRCVQK